MLRLYLIKEYLSGDIEQSSVNRFSNSLRALKSPRALVCMRESIHLKEKEFLGAVVNPQFVGFDSSGSTICSPRIRFSDNKTEAIWRKFHFVRVEKFIRRIQCILTRYI